jgi:flagellar protein FlaF
MSLNAYKRARNIAEQPRMTERRLVSEITGEMINAREAGHSGGALMPTLHRNRQLWGTFSAVCSADDNALPDQLRASIISLALWVNRHTSEVISGRGSIDALIDVNRSMIEGLSGSNRG